MNAHAAINTEAATEAPWINWTGDKCPVPATTRVEYRYGTVCMIAPAHRLDWKRRGWCTDIAAYRVVQS